MSENAPIKTWSEKGPGRKQCPGCEKYIGVRSASCPACGHEFPKREKVLKLPKPRQVESNAATNTPKPKSTNRTTDDGRPFLCIPAGKCPVELEDTSEHSVRSWMKDLEAKHPEFQLTAECYRYWARNIVGFGTERYREVDAVISASVR